MKKTLNTFIGVGAAIFITANAALPAKGSARAMPIQPLMGDTIRTPCSTPAKTPIAYAQAIANMEASRKRAYAALGEGAPVEDVAPEQGLPRKEMAPAIPASALNDLYSQVNNYSDLTHEQREELGRKVAETKDADLIETYNAMKARYSAKPAQVEVKETPEEGKALPAKEKVGEEQGKALETGGSPASNAIDRLYQQVNNYSDLTPEQREELGRKVEATGDADLIDTYNGMKAQYISKPAPVEIKPAGADSAAIKDVPVLPSEGASAPAEGAKLPADSSGYEVTLPPRIEGRIDKMTQDGNPEARKEGVRQTMEDVYRRGTTNPEVINAVVQTGLKQLRDSLETAVNECYASINAMAPETYREDSARIASAIAGIEAITGKSFPKGDSWVEYTLGNLKEYFAEMGQAIGSRRD